MPYGIDKNIGGDSDKNVTWMKKCIDGISGTNKRTGKPYTQLEKIAICKAQLTKNKSDSSTSFELDTDLINDVTGKIQAYKFFLFTTGKVSNEIDALATVEHDLAVKNFDITKLF